MLRPLYSNVVYERPKPNSKRGSMLFASKCLHSTPKNQSPHERLTYKKVSAPVVNVQRLIILNLRHGHITLIKNIRRVVFPRLRNSVWQPSTRVHTAKQHVYQTIAGLLTGNTSIEDCGDVGVVDPRLDKDGAYDVHDDDSVGAVGCGGVDEVFAAVPKSEVGTVAGVPVDGDVAY